jgi:hypothetical protein
VDDDTKSKDGDDINGTRLIIPKIYAEDGKDEISPTASM